MYSEIVSAIKDILELKDSDNANEEEILEFLPE
jgi:hypothetical protein